MTTKSVHILPDTAHPEGGFAVIRIDGVWLLHDRAIVRIEPLDEEGNWRAPDEGWPAVDQVPLDVRTTSRGIELVVGPAVVDAAALLPGQLVAVSVPAADVEAELVWPDIPRSLSLRANGDGLRVNEVYRTFATVQPISGVDAGEVAGLIGDEAAGNPNLLRGQGGGASQDGPASGRGSPRLPPPQIEKQADDDRQSSSRKRRDVPSNSTNSITVARPPPPGSAGLSPLAMFSSGLLATGAILLVAWYNAPTEVGSRAQQSLSEIYTVGNTSPRGVDARGFDRDDALLLANQLIHGIERPTDKEEGAFWLRKALSLKLSNEQMTWALTQLGSIYASASEGQPADYRSARTLWELAGVNGDPVALCFLGRLHEEGLGVAVSQQEALANYKKAQSLGGCPGIDAALARVGQ